MKKGDKTPQICVPILEKRQKAVLKKLKALKGKADLAEIWLDQIEDLDLKTLFKNKPLPILVVCKKEIEKGRFKGSYEAVAEVLIEAAKNGADIVDIPFKMPEKLSKKIVQKAKKTIISYHNFEKTPSNATLEKTALTMEKRGADISKIAVKGNSLKDVLNLIILAKSLENQGVKHILISMGKQGALSRILTPFLGGTIMFASSSPKEASAPGQMTIKELKKAWALIKT